MQNEKSLNKLVPGTINIVVFARWHYLTVGINVVTLR